eukprot:GHVU01191330.1.p1 GENE.GHVU01191330.1~~GHVU01191330.1.p1  ORF type:complete len:253 (+),score=38.44 GHVU01191330.1:551-1309(+)
MPLDVSGLVGRGWLAAFVASFSVIFMAELGDKTFFIAALMAMKKSHLAVFLGAAGALYVMTGLSVVVGYALPNLLSRTYTHYAGVILFIFFGIRLLMDGMKMRSWKDSDEILEVEAELAEVDEEQPRQVDPSVAETNNEPTFVQRTFSSFKRQLQKLCMSSWFLRHAVFWQAFSLTFLAEWGDRSQIATIALAAAQDPSGVFFGSVVGHSICTGLAVVGGKFLASRISEKAVALCGGALFFAFGVYGLVAGP